MLRPPEGAVCKLHETNLMTHNLAQKIWEKSQDPPTIDTLKQIFRKRRETMTGGSEFIIRDEVYRNIRKGYLYYQNGYRTSEYSETEIGDKGVIVQGLNIPEQKLRITDPRIIKLVNLLTSMDLQLRWGKELNITCQCDKLTFYVWWGHW